MQSAFRRNLLRLHTWVGLSAGFAMLFLAVTGGLLVMRPHFEDMLNRNLVSASTCVAPLPLDQVGQIARAAGPREKLDSYEVTREPGRAVAVKFGNKDYVYVDACNGRVLGVQNQYGGFYGVVDWLHRFRFMENGRDVAGWLNMAVLVFLVVGGLVLWWPTSRGGFKAALQFNGRLPGIARTLSLHKVIGIYACALLLALTVTGLPLSFDWAKGVIAAVTHSSTENPRRKFPHLKLRGPRLPVDMLWARAEAAVPDMAWGAIKTAKDNGVVEVEILERGAPHANAKSYLYLNSVTGQVLEFAPYATAMPLGRKVYLYVLALHSGLIGGIGYQLALMLACFSVPVQVYSGLSPYLRKKFRRAARPGLALRVAARREEAEGICSFEFEEARGRPLPPFSAGSHIDLTIAPGLTRQYSLCNDPQESHRYQIAILREPQSRGGSRTMHDQVQVGDTLTASLPRNHFPLAHDAPRSLLIAGGIGITPILCMAERLAAIGADFDLHYCARSRRRAPFLDRIAASHIGAHAHFHFGDEGTALEVEDLLAGEAPTTHIYVCGPGRLIDEVVGTATALGWDEALVHREYFVAAAHDTSHDTAFDIRIASDGRTVHVEKDQTVVEALAAIGIAIPTSCSEGVCGTCVTRVLEGEVVHRDLLQSPAERARNDQFTPCCSRAAGPLLVLDL